MTPETPHEGMPCYRKSSAEGIKTPVSQEKIYFSKASCSVAAFIKDARFLVSFARPVFPNFPYWEMRREKWKILFCHRMSYLSKEIMDLKTPQLIFFWTAAVLILLWPSFKLRLPSPWYPAMYCLVVVSCRLPWNLSAASNKQAWESLLSGINPISRPGLLRSP